MPARQLVCGLIALEGRTIAEGSDARQRRVMMQAIEQRLAQELERTPTFNEIWEQTSYSREEAEAAWYPVEVTVALDAPLGEGVDSDSSYDIQADANAVKPEEELRQNELNEALFNTLSELRQTGKLSDLHIQILIYKYGLFGADELSIAETRQRLGIKDTAYRKLLNEAIDALAGRQELKTTAEDPELFESVSEKPLETASTEIKYKEATVNVTPTELKILQGLQNGERVVQIAKDLDVKHPTAKNFIDRVRHKFDIKTQQELIEILPLVTYTPLKDKK